MLSTDLSTIALLLMLGLTVGATISAWIAARVAYRAEKYAEGMGEWMSLNNEKSLTMKGISEINLQLADHDDLLHSTIASLKRLHSRSGMRELREKRKVNPEVPDPREDPEGWKRAMRLKLNAGAHIDRGD